ncbi:MAG: hypothetical protein KKG47_08190 [Proteobacteria bacterium]|nr:hypothetical protein [Pseudomonadota bacterium]MBU1739513.1 hypothetical protein [Pseudomonadota bacterium]
MTNRNLQKYISLLTILSLVALFGIVTRQEALAADRLYFVSVVERSPVTNNLRVLLEWGALEGSIPGEIKGFRLYRATGGEYENLVTANKGTIPAGLVDDTTLRSIALRDNDAEPYLKLLTTLNHMSVNGVPNDAPLGPTITGADFHTYVHALLDPASPQFDPLKRMLLMRQFPHLAMAAGLAFVDETVTPGNTYQYMLTAVDINDVESLPIGQTEPIVIDGSTETVLPAPQGLRQVEVNDCSSIRKGIDDLMIYLNWDVPARPQDIGHNVLVYGYDVFWAESDLGAVDLRQGIPAGLNRLNDQPIIVAGAAPATGSDSFLTRDDGKSHTTGPKWRRGQKFYYYLAALDISGHYSETSAPVEATVVDGIAPPMVWNVHTEEVTQLIDTNGSQTSEPRLAIAFDQINPVNYARFYGAGKNICSSDATEVCYTRGEESCGDPAKVRCVDLDVLEYRIFRFASPEEASQWGDDMDGDLWPDDQEKALGFDACNANDKPAGDPAAYVKTISQNDPVSQHAIAPEHIQMNSIDYAMQPDDHVYWYKIVAVDQNFNSSPVSPPIRAVLYNRSQPTPNATLEVCSGYQVDHTADMIEQVPGDSLVLVDETGLAASFAIYERCTGTSHQEPASLVIHGSTTGRVTHIDKKVLSRIGCAYAACSSFAVYFYDRNGSQVGVSPSFYMDGTNLCTESFYGTITLQETCTSWGLSKPGLVNEGPSRVCVDLGAGESARIYHRIGDSMSPFLSVPQQGATGGNVCENIPVLEGLSSAELCLGVRAFSSNHVGSAMRYLDCQELPAAAPEPEKTIPAPMMEGVYSKEEQGTGTPYFELRWAAPGEGAALFVLAVKGQDDTRYKTIWDAAQDESGQFVYQYSLDQATEMGQELCFKMRSMNSAMANSDWSTEICETWTATEDPNLPWPWVREPAAGSEFTAFYLKEGATLGGRPAIVMSRDLAATTLLTVYPLCESGTQAQQIQTCTGSGQCMDDSPDEFRLPCATLCDTLQPALKSFIVYRQEEGRDFVQVSPLINRFACLRTKTYVFFPMGGGGEWVDQSIIQDPFLYLRNLEDTVIGGGVDPALANGVRLIFVDRYPFRSGSKARYKILAIDDRSGEIIAEHQTNWFILQ